MKLTIHRGTRQIGGSCVELRAQSGERVLLDMGMPLTREDGSDWPRGTMSRPTSELIAEGILPDLSGLYADADPEFFAVALSHAHLDHHGLAHHVHPNVPVYGSAGTLAMLRVSKLFVPDAVVPEKLHKLPVAGSVNIGSFRLRGIPVDHAAPDSRALLVEADGQRVLYTGDLRAHGRGQGLFDALAEEATDIDALIMEGTTVGQQQGSHGFPCEVDVERRLVDLLKESPGLVAVIASGQNVDRAISVYQAALATGRELVIDPYQAFVLLVLKDICPGLPQYDSPSVRVKFISGHVNSMKEKGFWPLACKMSRAAKVSADQMAENPRGYVYLGRSSTATVRILERICQPTVVWSQWGGYLQKGGPVPQYCAEQGIKPILIHSGGHAHPEDLADLARRINPRVVIPIHTEAAAQFTNFISNVCVIEDGVQVELSELNA